MIIKQDANFIIKEKLGKEISRDKNYFLDLGFAITRLFLWLALAIYAVAPTIRCMANMDENTFLIERQRFWGITTYKNQVQLDTIDGIYMLGSDDLDTMGSRLALKLKSGDRVLVTYVGEQSDRSRLELCESFNQWLKSKTT